MLATMLVCAALAADPAKPSAEDKATYQAGREKAGRDPNAHVQLALWCEQHGLTDERFTHLTLAATLDPANALARGLLGLVADGGKWRRPEAVTQRAQNDANLAANLAEYTQKRSEAAHTADAQWHLAVWCEEHGLKPEATAHLTVVVRLDSSRDAAWKRLGYKKVGRHWKTDAQVVEEKLEADAQKKADIQWSHVLAKLKADLRDPRRKAAAEAALADVTDPRALPMVLKTFGTKEIRDQTMLVQLLGQVDSPRASRVLALSAIFLTHDQARRAAAETLRRRDPREFADLLIGLMRPVIKYDVKRIEGPGTTGELVIHTKQADIRRLYRPSQWIDSQPADKFVGYDQSGLPVVSRVVGPAYETPFYNIEQVFGSLPNYATAPLTVMGAKRPPELERIPGLSSTADLAVERLAAFEANPFLPNNMALAGGLGMAPGLLASFNADLDASYQQVLPYQQILSGEVGMGRSTNVSYTVASQATLPIGRIQAEAMKTAVVAAGQLDGDVTAIDAHNAPIAAMNAAASTLLTAVSGQSLGEDREAWRDWYVDQIGFNPDRTQQAAGSRTSITEDVPLAYTPEPIPVTTTFGPIAYQRISCFGAGTPVRTLDGMRPIEQVRVGDRVLSQDATSGALGFQPILAVHHNPPSATFRVDLGGEKVVASPFHRFWLAGKGWKMARDLKPGDVVRTLEGTAKVVAVSSDRVQKVYNLDVAESRTFFVGKTAALVHDNSVPDFRASPYDAPALAKMGPAK